MPTTYQPPTETPLTAADLTILHQDALRWRALLRLLTGRGFTEMTPERIANVFPNFDPHPTKSKTDTNAQTGSADPSSETPAPRKEGVKKPPQPNAPISMQLKAANVPDDALVFAEIITTLGPCEVGCTRAGELLFEFTVTHEVLLLPIADLVTDLVNQLHPRVPQPAARRHLM